MEEEAPAGLLEQRSSYLVVMLKSLLCNSIIEL